MITLLLAIESQNQVFMNQSTCFPPTHMQEPFAIRCTTASLTIRPSITRVSMRRQRRPLRWLANRSSAYAWRPQQQRRSSRVAAAAAAAAADAWTSASAETDSSTRCQQRNGLSNTRCPASTTIKPTIIISNSRRRRRSRCRRR